MSTHWSGMSRNWGETMPPLKPSPQDLEVFQNASRQHLNETSTVLILGVTQELYRLAWPLGTTIMAVDRNEDMIANVWPGPPGSALCADWRAIPLNPGLVQVFLCDGGITCLSYPSGVRAVATELRRIAASPARAIVRLYVPPSVPEEPDEVLADLGAGRISNLSEFKLRIATAMQADPETGVTLADIWNVLERFAPDRNALAKRIGWRREHLDAIDTYRGSTEIYRFPTLEQVALIFSAEGWRLSQDLHSEDSRCAFAFFDLETDADKPRSARPLTTFG